MGIFDWLKKRAQAEEPEAEPAEEPPEPVDAESFVYVMIPGNIMPLERGDLFEDPIDDLLAERELGSVTGGGSQMGEDDAEGNPTVEYCGIDIDVTELSGALVLLREALVSLKAPEGTEIHYTRAGEKLLDALESGTWKTEQPRAHLHPGFGI